jgi:hypothetical protein
VQNLAILYAHQQGLVYNVDNGDTGRWTVCRENSFFLTHGLTFLIVSRPKI